MNSRSFKSDKSILLAESKHILSSSDDALFIRKVVLVNLMLNGINASELSKYCDETTRTLTSWMKKVDENGFDSLKKVKQSGRPYKLSKIQIEEIKTILESNPVEYGYSAWNGSNLSSFISKKFNVSISVRQCQRLMKSLTVIF